MAKRNWPVRTHGYGGYSCGCRCDTCRTAKAVYMRDKRAQAAAVRESAGERYTATGITHGTSGYKDSGCRCRDCCRAVKTIEVRRRRRLLLDERVYAERRLL